MGPRLAQRILNVHGLGALLIPCELFASVIAHAVSKLPGCDRSVMAVTSHTVWKERHAQRNARLFACITTPLRAAHSGINTE